MKMGLVAPWILGGVLGSGWHVRTRAFPERFGDARAGGDGDEMGVVGRSRKSESEVGFFDFGGGAEVAGEDAVAVGEEFQLVGLDPGRPQYAGMNFHFLVRTGVDIPGAIPVIHLHVNQQAHADVGPHVSETFAGFSDVDFIRMRVGAFHIGAGLAEDEAANVVESLEPTPVMACPQLSIANQSR